MEALAILKWEKWLIKLIYIVGDCSDIHNIFLVWRWFICSISVFWINDDNESNIIC